MICEKNAEIREEEILQDDNGSGDESGPESEVFDLQSSTYNLLSQPTFSKVESNNELLEQPEIESNNYHDKDSGALKKFAAPKPPILQEEAPEPKHEVNFMKKFKYFNFLLEIFWFV